jgi:hypothetical protein
MALHARSVLSPSLTAKLSTLGTKLGRERSDRELGETLAELSALPAAQIARASREIARAAGLGWWRQPSLMDELLGWPPSERKLMATNPDYAWLFLFHPNGHVREAALHSIKTPPKSQFFLAALAWRLNDWVGPVRQAAKRCVKRISAEVPATVAADAAASLLDRRFVWGRWRDEANILDLILARDDVLAALVAQLQDRPTGAQAACLRNTLQYTGIDQYLPRLAASAVQPSVRAVAYRCLIAGKATWPVSFAWAWVDKVYGVRRRLPKLETRDIQRDRAVVDFVAAGIRDNSPFVRKIVADAMIAVRSQIPNEETLVAQLAKDRSSAVRSRADFMLRNPPSMQIS